MTPSARVAAAIEILDRVLAGEPADKIVTNWGRRNRYAGSKDRAAIRDLVFSSLRCRRSYGYLGGADTGRGLMLGWALASELDPNTLFTGDKYAPPSITEADQIHQDLSKASRGIQQDCPDWLLEKYDMALGETASDVLQIMQSRAPVFLRVNRSKSDRQQAADLLANEGISTKPHELSDTALQVLENPRRVAQSKPYQGGIVEIQDAASQALVDFLPLTDGQTVLDYCAGGGGKSLAMAARKNIKITAHDIDINRMSSIPERAERAGITVEQVSTDDLSGARFDLVLCDAPCSGNGAWRRNPDAKWRLTPDDLNGLCDLQAGILEAASDHVSPGGWLAYATCSLFVEENLTQIETFCKRGAGWTLKDSKQFSPLDGGDGFFVALVKRV